MRVSWIKFRLLDAICMASDLEVSVFRVTLFRLIRRPPTPTKYDRGEACCCTTSTLTALHSFHPGSGFTLTWSPGLSGSSSLVQWRS